MNGYYAELWYISNNYLIDGTPVSYRTQPIAKTVRQMDSRTELVRSFGENRVDSDGW